MSRRTRTIAWKRLGSEVDVILPVYRRCFSSRHVFVSPFWKALRLNPTHTIALTTADSTTDRRTGHEEETVMVSGDHAAHPPSITLGRATVGRRAPDPPSGVRPAQISVILASLGTFAIGRAGICSIPKPPQNPQDEAPTRLHRSLQPPK